VGRNEPAPASDSVDTLRVFCRQVNSRSQENFSAFHLLFHEKHWGNVLSIIGQEIDSMIRVVYLLTIVDKEHRKQLIDDSVGGRKWTHKGSTRRITDRQMVETATSFEFWMREAYKVRNGFIHLSNLHDYKERDPLNLIPKQDKREIIKHLRRYHGGLRQSNPVFEDVIPFLPKVLSKMQQHLRGYLGRLEGQTSSGTFLPLGPPKG
jgi:hypothetical protein